MRPRFSRTRSRHGDLSPPRPHAPRQPSAALWQEVQFLSFLQRSRMRAEMAAEKMARAERTKMQEEAAKGGGVAPTDDAGDNFYQLLQEARDILPDNSWWVQ